MKRVSSVGILLRANGIAVAILIAAVIVAAVVAIGSDGRGADRRRPRGACYRAAVSIAAVSIAAPRVSPVSPTGNAVSTAANCSAPEMGGTSVIASTPIAATTAPTCERIIRHEAGAD
jgi:hypothetical protein